MNNQITIRRQKSAGANVQSLLGNLPMFSEMSREELDRIAAFTLPNSSSKYLKLPSRFCARPGFASWAF